MSKQCGKSRTCSNSKSIQLSQSIHSSIERPRKHSIISYAKEEGNVRMRITPGGESTESPWDTIYAVQIVIGHFNQIVKAERSASRF
ncbi:hypothetical protein GMOD_00007173 [Pyrenophora seminiperda CCB06]|uniref:Uncharacterized protein n=1 Tax=Pyrenophora seminiperda CCB06 TaxID=1302712 RepID=A0A3M7MCN6_9PLEO|nr:hypothetical protein GMOD_00007173 [Pyrenophora seminiperda CCB06]